MVAAIADHYDDEIVSLAGGTLASAGSTADQPAEEMQSAG